MRGFLHRVDARVAFIGLLVIGTFPFIVTDLLALLVLMVGILVLAFFHRDALCRYKRGVKGLLGMALMVGALQVLLAGGTPILEFDLIGFEVSLISAEGLYFAGSIMARIFILVGSALLFSSTVEERPFLEGLRSLRAPSNIVLSVNLVLRMLPRMVEDISEAGAALSMREGMSGGGSYLHRWRTFVKVIRPFFAAYITSTHRLGLSMEMRGYTGDIGRGKGPGRLGPIDIAASPRTPRVVR